MDPDPSSSPSSSRPNSLDGSRRDIEEGIFAWPPPPRPASLPGGERRTRGTRRAGFFFVDDCSDEPRHFLDSCFLCKRPLSGNRDIFMYRGDAPFCSVECRQEQIEMDEASEKKVEMRISRKSSPEEQSASRSSSPESEKIRLRADTAVVAG